MSCLSKAMAVVFSPVLVLLYFWNDNSEDNMASLKKIFSPKIFLHFIPFFTVSLLFGIIAAKVQAGGDFYGMLEKTSDSVAINKFDTFSLLQRFQFACYGFTEYIIKFFVPSGLCTFYPYPDQPTYDKSSWFSFVPVITSMILAGAAFSIKYTKSILVGIGFYLVTVILVLQFLSVGVVLMADRYTYLPYIGFAFIFVMLVQEFVKKNLQLPAYVLMLVFCGLLIPKTIQQIETWEDSETLWTNVIELHLLDGKILQQNMEQPLSIRGNFYGKMSEKAKTPAEAMQYIDKAFEDFKKAAQLGSNRAEVYEGMGNTYGKRGYDLQIKGQAGEANKLFKEALKNYNKALELKPNKGSTYFNRAITYSILGDHTNAINDYTNAIKFNPQQIEKALVNRGLSYNKTGQREKAIADFTEGLRYNPNNINALNNRGLAYSQSGQNGKAIADFKMVLQIAPGNKDAQNYLNQISNSK